MNNISKSKKVDWFYNELMKIPLYDYEKRKEFISENIESVILDDLMVWLESRIHRYNTTTNVTNIRNEIKSKVKEINKLRGNKDV